VKSALRTTTEELADLYNNAPCGYHSLDKDGVFIRINDTELRWLGYSREEVIGKMKFHDLITDRSLKTFQDNFPQFKVRGWIHDLEFEMVRKDGSILPVLLSASAVTDPDGNYIMSRSTVYDITERKRAEREVVQLAAIVEFSDDAIIGKTPDGIITSWNKGAERIYGYTADEIVGKPISTLVPADHADEVPQILDKIRRGEHIEHYETVRRRKDGELIEMSLAISPIRETEGKITGASTIGRDITAQKRIESINMARLRLLQFAATHTLDELLETTLNEVEVLTGSLIGFYHFLEADQKTLSLQNWSTRTKKEYCLAEGKGRHYNVSEAGVWVDCIHERRPVIHNDYSSLPHRKGLPAGHSPVVRELVVPVFRRESIVAILGVGNKPRDYTTHDVETVSLLADLAWEVVERKRIEEALSLLAAIVEFSDDAIIGISPEGTIVSWNRGAERLYGYPAEEVKVCPVSILIPDDHPEEMAYILDHVRQGKPIERHETVRLRKDGSRVEVSVTISPICDSGGKIIGASTIARDITGLKKAEIELRKLNEELELRVIERTADLNRRSTELSESQQALMNIVEDLNEKTDELEGANTKLKEFDRLKSMFIASMSHELRTPLNSIIGFSSVILNEWIGPVNAEQKENLAIILRCGKHLLNLINDVIDVSKIEAGKIESVAEEFDLYDLISEAVGLVRKDMEEKGLDLQVAATHQQMHMDRRRLLQCVLNLLSNALKFTEHGGLTVETRIMPCPGEALEAGVAEISVTDTGIGIREEDLPKMFQPFVRLASPLQATVPGTGLGLYLTRKLAAEVLKGDILLTSEYGKGSRFTLRIPVRLP